MREQQFDVVVLGGGLAGLTLTRHLRQETDCSVLLLERRSQLPRSQQKVGESSVQLAGYYFARVLGLEEHLLKRHAMKYNLRFYHRCQDAEPQGWEDLSQLYIAPFSNVASYQIDRNLFERELLRGLDADPLVEVRHPTAQLAVELGKPQGEERARHRVTYDFAGQRYQALSKWVIDASGRRRFLAQQMGLKRPSPIGHAASFGWVDGLLDLERMTRRSAAENRRAPERRLIGHTPLWLATNHLCFEGGWLWLIPLPQRTSIGLVFDRSVLDPKEVAGPERLRAWIQREFPLVGRALEKREIVDWGGFRDFAHDCEQVLSSDGWAMTGESGRFSDPLYSPGSDLIALHNTLIVHAIRAPEAQRGEVCRRHERMLQALYRAYLPAYSVSYNALGDAECMALKYGWELSIYFAFYVFPFLNDLFTDRRFNVLFLRRFARLGQLNDAVHGAVSQLFQLKKRLGHVPGPKVFFDLRRFPALVEAEKSFYQVGLNAVQAGEVLDQKLAILSRLARFILAWSAAWAAGDPRRVLNPGWVAGLELPDPLVAPRQVEAEPCFRRDEETEWAAMVAALEPFSQFAGVSA